MQFSKHLRFQPDFPPLINSRFDSDPTRHELEFFSDPPTPKKILPYPPTPPHLFKKKSGCRPPSPLINSGTPLSLRNPEICAKYLTGFRRYGCLNSDISKYGHLKESAFILNYKSKIANVLTDSNRHTIQASVCQIS